MILNAERRWECPSCHQQHVTTEHRPHTPFHACKALGGLTAPFVEVRGSELDRHAARHVVVERGDYIGDDKTAGRVMAVNTERADGSNDCTVYAPTAIGSAKALDTSRKVR